MVRASVGQSLVRRRQKPGQGQGTRRQQQNQPASIQEG